MTPKVCKFRLINHPFILGFAEVELQDGIVLLDVAVIRDRGEIKIRFRKTPIIRDDGSFFRDESGKLKSQAMFRFADAEQAAQFQSAVIAQIAKLYPRIFG